MKAIVYDKYGSPDVLELKEIDKPAVGDDQVLIRVRAASVNPLDWHFMRGRPFFLRIKAGLRKPKVIRLGVDAAGTVESAGGNVTRLNVSRCTPNPVAPAVDCLLHVFIVHGLGAGLCRPVARLGQEFADDVETGRELG